MKAKFVINERPSINTFLYVLKILYSNSPEVLFHFHKTGISLSQSWQDKDPERGKYFFFLQDTHFSKILCNEENIFLRFNIKEILQKLRSAKKEIMELFISISNENKTKGVNKSFCLIEITAALSASGTVIYKNGCKLETNSKAIIPSAYYDNLQVDKPLLFSVLPSKMDFLSTFKNNFLKMKFTEEKISCEVNQQRITLNTLSCFSAYNYRIFNALYGEIDKVIIPPNHLIRYMDICSKWKREMAVHLGKISNTNGTIKLYCPVRIERGLFILKIKPQYLETDLTSQMKFNPSTTFSLGSQSRITNIGGISSIMAPPHPHNSRSRIGLNTSSKYSMNMSLTETSQVIMKGGTNPKNSMPSKLTFSGHGEGYSSGQSQQNQQLNNKKFRANPFKFSQENVTKKMKMNDEEKTSGESVEISLPIIVISSQKISKKDSQSVETESTSKKKVMSSGKKRKKVEIIEIIGSESREKLKKREIKKKFETESPQFPGTSIPDGNSVTRTINPEQTKHLQSSTRNLNLFKGRPTSFISLLNDTSKTENEIQRGYQSSAESRRINENFEKRMKEILKDMKL